MPKKSLALGIVLILIIVSALFLAARNPIDLSNNESADSTRSPQIATSTNPQQQSVVLDTLINNSVIASPLTIKGKARGLWYFEASFPVKLLDASGNVLAQTPAQAEGEWMTTEHVPFTAILTFAPPQTTTGTLVFEKDNPSGLPEFDQSISIPVRFVQVSTSSVAVKLYYPNGIRAEEIGDACSQDTIQPVDRLISITKTPVQDTIKLLIRGELTAREKAQGFTTEFPRQGFNLINANLRQGTLTLEFAEVPGFTTGGSCRVMLLAQQIIKTAKQFPDVKTVVLKPDSLFQP